MILDDIDKKIIGQLQGDIPLVPQPFLELAGQLGISEDEYLMRLQEMRKNGILRRVAAVLRHRESGFKHNAMLVWQQDEEEADQIGAKLAEIKVISHLYMRQGNEIWPYNMYAMVHGRSEDELRQVAAMVGEITGNENINIVKSNHEYKKTSMQYDLKE